MPVSIDEKVLNISDLDESILEAEALLNSKIEADGKVGVCGVRTHVRLGITVDNLEGKTLRGISPITIYINENGQFEADYNEWSFPDLSTHSKRLLLPNTGEPINLFL